MMVRFGLTQQIIANRKDKYALDGINKIDAFMKSEGAELEKYPNDLFLKWEHWHGNAWQVSVNKGENGGGYFKVRDLQVDFQDPKPLLEMIKGFAEGVLKDIRRFRNRHR